MIALEVLVIYFIGVSIFASDVGRYTEKKHFICFVIFAPKHYGYNRTIYSVNGPNSSLHNSVLFDVTSYPIYLPNW